MQLSGNMKNLNTKFPTDVITNPNPNPNPNLILELFSCGVEKINIRFT